MCGLAYRRLAKQVNIAGTASDNGEYREALEAADEAITMARKWKFPPDDVVAVAFLIRAEALRKKGNSQASAGSFGAGVHVHDTGHARRAIPILQAAVGLGHRAEAQPLSTANRLERAGMASFRVGVYANAAAAFGKAIDLMTKEKGADALALASPYINLGNCYKRMQKLTTPNGATARPCGSIRGTAPISANSFRSFC